MAACSEATGSYPEQHQGLANHNTYGDQSVLFGGEAELDDPPTHDGTSTSMPAGASSDGNYSEVRDFGTTITSQQPQASMDQTFVDQPQATMGEDIVNQPQTNGGQTFAQQMLQCNPDQGLGEPGAEGAAAMTDNSHLMANSLQTPHRLDILETFNIAADFNTNESVDFSADFVFGNDISFDEFEGQSNYPEPSQGSAGPYPGSFQ